jgi:hypothetical protein
MSLSRLLAATMIAGPPASATDSARSTTAPVGPLRRSDNVRPTCVCSVIAPADGVEHLSDVGGYPRFRRVKAR